MKLGTGFEQVVADVCREMDPGADVQQGVWQDGPDGRRNLDVVVGGQVDGRPHRIHIECKDYSPNHPVGIGLVDAIASKHEDMKFDLSLLCSNAGFTSGAISKAKRKDIGLIGVLREHDDRVKYEIVDEVYGRRIEMDGTCDVTYHYPEGSPTLHGINGSDIQYQGKPVLNWMIARIPSVLTMNLVVSGKLRTLYKFKKPIRVQHAITRQKSLLDWCYIDFAFAGTWVSFESRISASSGIYDWLRKAVRVGPTRSFSVSWKDFTFGTGGVEMYEPPQHLFPDWPHNNPTDGIAIHRVGDIGNLALPHPDQVPNLTALIVPEDLDPRCRDLQESQLYPAKRLNG